MSRRPGRLRLRQWFGLTTGLLLVVGMVGIAAGLFALERHDRARAILAEGLHPAAFAALQLESALLTERSGVRGYLVTGRHSFLTSYRQGRIEQEAARAALERATSVEGARHLRRDVRALDRALAAWTRGFAEPAIARAQGRAVPRRTTLDDGGVRFERLRASLERLEQRIFSTRAGARERLASAAATVEHVFIGFGVMFTFAVLAVAWTLQASTLKPLGRLVGQVRHVARGDFDRTVEVTGGGREFAELGEDIDGMRRRILAAVAAADEAREVVERQALDLERSNAELEQFAYMASHDLQEPLRNVKSFTELLQQRYSGQLDARADQYIGHAVDGARRMQELINDLLAFSRLGRGGRVMTPVETAAVVRTAVGNLQARVEETGATVEVGELPAVEGDAGLLTLVFQNLIGNALKFTGDARPHVRIDARASGACWEFSCADNGIGIGAEDADRIFEIFQRLHTRAEYEGTGIGLAMCRKIVEHHGGRIWLSQNGGPDGEVPGATFRFTLPRA